MLSFPSPGSKRNQDDSQMGFLWEKYLYSSRCWRSGCRSELRIECRFTQQILVQGTETLGPRQRYPVVSFFPSSHVYLNYGILITEDKRSILNSGRQTDLLVGYIWNDNLVGQNILKYLIKTKVIIYFRVFFYTPKHIG